jgi:putative heme iron utilization protein
MNSIEKPNRSDFTPGRQARELLRCASTASLATLMDDGAPYASLVTVAADDELSPVLLLSDLAQHTKNVVRDARASLLIDGTGGGPGDPLDGPRLTLLGTLERADEESAAVFLGRHPQSKDYAGFADFHFYRLRPSRAQLVSGFGKVAWLMPADLRGESSQ